MQNNNADGNNKPKEQNGNKLQDNKLSTNLSENIDHVKEILGNSFDIKYTDFSVEKLTSKKFTTVNIKSLSDEKKCNEFVIAPLLKFQKSKDEELESKTNSDIDALEEIICVEEFYRIQNWDDFFDEILKGNTCILIENCEEAIVINTRGYEIRAISEPEIEGELRGPRDGFIEDIATNITLIRRRIRDVSLRVIKVTLGERTKTDIAIVYIENLADDNILKDLKERLSKIKIDAVLATASLEEFIADNRWSPFPQVQNTERPDKASAAILEGRIVIIVDNTPFVLIVPAVFTQFFQASGDYYDNFIGVTFVRLIRVISLFLSISLSSFYVLLTSFHHEMIPTGLALKMAAGRQGLPFPAVLEAFIMEIMFEIFREAGIRMPRPIGQTVSIVGTLVIGQAAVAAGIVSPALVIVIAAASISSFTVPAFNMSNAFRFIRFPILALAGTFGLLGYLIGLIIVSLHLVSLKSFDIPYLSPIIPFNKSDLKDFIYRAPIWKMNRRPKLNNPKDEKRQK